MPPLVIAGAMAAGALAGGLGSKQTIGMQGGFDINKKDFEIKDLEKYQGQSQGQFDRATGQQAFVDPKQRSFLESLGQQANGQGPSLAVEQLKQAQNRNLAQQMAAAQAARAGNPALMQRQVMQQAAQANQQTAAASTQARMQEQLNAQNIYGNQLNNYTAAANQGAMGAINQGFGMAQAQQQALAQYNQLASGQATNMSQLNAGIDASNAQTRSDMFKNIAGGAMQGLTMMSDETQKQDIKDSSKDMKSFLSKLSEKSYEYKDSSLPGTASGRRFGIIAQDLEKSNAGKSIVKDTPHGKMVDVQQGFGVALGALAHLNKRLAKLEK